MWWIRVLKAVAAAILVALLLLFVFAAAAFSAEDPDRLIGLLGPTALVAGAAACGAAAGIFERREESNGLTSGFAGCAVYLALGLVLSRFFAEDGGRMWACYPLALAAAFAVQLVIVRLEKKGKRVSPAKLRRNTLKRLSKH